MSIIDPRKEYRPSRGSIRRPSVLKSCRRTLTTMLWGSAFSNKLDRFHKVLFPIKGLKRMLSNIWISLIDISINYFQLWMSPWPHFPINHYSNKLGIHNRKWHGAIPGPDILSHEINPSAHEIYNKHGRLSNRNMTGHVTKTLYQTTECALMSIYGLFLNNKFIVSQIIKYIFKKGGKHWGKRRNCWQPFSSFLSKFRKRCSTSVSIKKRGEGEIVRSRDLWHGHQHPLHNFLYVSWLISMLVSN